MTERVVERYLARAARFDRRAPQPPRGIQYENATLRWEPPQRTGGVTHYRIYKDSDADAALVREVPAGQVELSDFLEAEYCFISSYNAATRLESERIPIFPATGIGGVETPGVLPSIPDTDSLKNPGFEQGLQHWGVTGTVLEETSIRWAEAKGIRMPGNGGVNYVYQHVQCQPGESFRFVAMVRNGTNATVGACQITFKDKDYAPLSGFYETTVPANDTWTRAEMTHTAPAGTAWVMVIPAYTTGAHTTGSLYADQCSLTRVTAGQAFPILVAGAAVTVVTRTLTEGPQQWRAEVTWTPVPSTADKAKVRVVILYGGKYRILGEFDSSLGAGVTAWDRLPPSAEASIIRVRYLSKDEVESTLFTDFAVTIPAEAGTPIIGSKIANIPAAAFASTIQPVGIVSAVPDGSGNLAIVKVQDVVLNTYNGLTYEWDNGAGVYKRIVSGAKIKAELTLDKLTVGQISAGAISTTELFAGEILVGLGGGKPTRFKVVDAFSSMIGFIGDDGAGYTGAFFSKARIGGSIGAPAIDATASAVSIVGATFSLTVGGVTTVINNSVSGGLAEGLKVIDSFNRARVAPGTFEAGSTTTPRARMDATGFATYDSLGTLNAEWPASTGIPNCPQYRVGGTKVVGARATGWGFFSGYTDRSGFDTSTVTVSQLAERVYALLLDLGLGGVYHGLIGT